MIRLRLQYDQVFLMVRQQQLQIEQQLHMEAWNPKYAVLETEKMHIYKVQLQNLQDRSTSTRYFQFRSEAEMKAKIDSLNQRKQLDIVGSLRNKEIFHGQNLQVDTKTQNIKVFQSFQLEFGDSSDQESSQTNKTKLIKKVLKPQRQLKLESKIAKLQTKLESKDKAIQQSQKKYKQEIQKLTKTLLDTKKQIESNSKGYAQETQKLNLELKNSNRAIEQRENKNAKDIEKHKQQLLAKQKVIEQNQKTYRQEMKNWVGEKALLQEQKATNLQQILVLRGVIQNRYANNVEIARLRQRLREQEAHNVVLERFKNRLMFQLRTLGVVIVEPNFWKREI